MADSVTPDLTKEIERKNKKINLSVKDIVPVLDEAIDKSHSTDELINIALVSVVSVVVANVVKGILGK